MELSSAIPVTIAYSVQHWSIEYVNIGMQQRQEINFVK